jgi:hypothetical protein
VSLRTNGKRSSLDVNLFDHGAKRRRRFRSVIRIPQAIACIDHPIRDRACRSPGGARGVRGVLAQLLTRSPQGPPSSPVKPPREGHGPRQAEQAEQRKRGPPGDDGHGQNNQQRCDRAAPRAPSTCTAPRPARSRTGRRRSVRVTPISSSVC